MAHVFRIDHDHGACCLAMDLSVSALGERNCKTCRCVSDSDLEGYASLVCGEFIGIPIMVDDILGSKTSYI